MRKEPGTIHLLSTLNGGSSRVKRQQQQQQQQQRQKKDEAEVGRNVSIPVSVQPKLTLSLPSSLSISCQVGSETTPTTPIVIEKHVRKLRKEKKRTTMGFGRRWWQRKRKGIQTKEDIVRRLHKVEQLIELITKKHELVRYDKIAEKYLQWEHHLREQMMIRRWGTSRNVELEGERKRDIARIDCLKKRREALVRLIRVR